MTSELERVMKKWGKAIQQPPAGTEGNTTMDILRSRWVKPVSINGNKVVVACRYRLHHECLLNPRNNTVVVEVLGSILGWKPKVGYSLDEEGTHFQAEIQAEKKRQEEREKAIEAERKREAQLAREQYLHRMKEKSRIPKVAFSTHRLNDFEIWPGNKEAYRVALDYLGLKHNLDKLDHEARDVLCKNRFLTLCGEPGRGKTRLAIGIALYQLLENQSPAEYWQVEELLDTLRFSFNKNSEPTADEILNRVKRVDTLILDDLGAHQATEWATAKLDEIIDYRYLNQMRTIFTTNMPPKDLSPRIASRLLEGTVVVLTCGDFRLLKAKRRVEAKGKRLSEKVIVSKNATHSTERKL